MSIVDKANASAAPMPAASSVFITLMPIMGAVFVAFFVIGMALPVLPLHVHQELGFGTFTVGVVTGSQFAASLFSRVWSGRTCDNQGAKYAMIVGLAAGSAAGLLYLLSLRLAYSPEISVAVLLLGRGVLGAAESFIITGATVWGLGGVGAHNAGKVIAWMGTAMFAAFAGGAPIGVAMYKGGGFAAVAAATAVAPLATLALVALLQPVAPQRVDRASIFSVLSKVWLPGLGAALSSIGFGVILSFASLLFATRGWMPLWLPFTSYAVALIAARTHPRPSARPHRRCEGRAHMRFRRGRGIGPVGAGVIASPRGLRRGPHWFWVCSRLSRTGRRGGSSCAAGTSRACNGRLYCLSRSRPGDFRAYAWFHRTWSRSRDRISGQRPPCALRSPHRMAPPTFSSGWISPEP